MKKDTIKIPNIKLGTTFYSANENKIIEIRYVGFEILEHNPNADSGNFVTPLFERADNGMIDHFSYYYNSLVDIYKCKPVRKIHQKELSLKNFNKKYLKNTPYHITDRGVLAVYIHCNELYDEAFARCASTYTYPSVIRFVNNKIEGLDSHFQWTDLTISITDNYYKTLKELMQTKEIVRFNDSKSTNFFQWLKNKFFN